MHEKKRRVAVLLGGASNEKEISLESGRNVCYKLSPHTYEVIPIFVNNAMELYPLTQSQLVRNSTHEIDELIDKTTKINWHDLPNICDFVFIALHGGEGENGRSRHRSAAIRCVVRFPKVSRISMLHLRPSRRLTTPCTVAAG